MPIEQIPPPPTLTAAQAADIAEIPTILADVQALQTAVTALQTSVNAIPTSIIKSIQRGFINNVAVSSGTGEDDRFVDTTITAVNTAKAFVLLQTFVSNAALTTLLLVTGRLTSSTNLRIAIPLNTPTNISGGWIVIEFN